MRTRHHAATGFTLIETLVALSIVALALATGMRATAALSYNAQRQSDVMLAQICAENELIWLRLSKQMPGTGDKQSVCEQAGQRFDVVTSTRPTPNPNFLRSDAKIEREGVPVLQLTTVIGRY
jgi:general secretion pathway protein I